MVFVPCHEVSNFTGTSEGWLWRVPGWLALVLHSAATTAQVAKQNVPYGERPCCSQDLGKQSGLLLQGRVDSLLSRRAQVASVQLEVDLQTWRT